jgi:hypothetical protein
LSQRRSTGGSCDGEATWQWEEELRLLREEIGSVADQLRKDKMVNHLLLSGLSLRDDRNMPNSYTVVAVTVTDAFWSYRQSREKAGKLNVVSRNTATMAESLRFLGSLTGHSGWVTAIATSSETPDFILTASRGKLTMVLSFKYHIIIFFLRQVNYRLASHS